MSNLSALDVLRLTFAFVADQWLRLLGLLCLPAIAIFSVLYLGLNFYLQTLQVMLESPSQARASILLGFVAVMFLALLLCYAVTASAVCRLVFAQPNAYPRLGYVEWRLYAAILRFFLLLALVAAALGALSAGLSVLDAPLLLQPFIEASWIAAMVLVAVRIGFLLPAVSIAEPAGFVLRRGWGLTSRLFWRLLVVAVLLTIPGTVFELVVEFLVRQLGILHHVPNAGTLQIQIALLEHVLPTFAFVICVVTVATATLETVASCVVYQAMTKMAVFPLLSSEYEGRTV